MNLLVTGGAGYIGSNLVQTAIDRGHEVVVLDDLSIGHRDAIASEARFVEGDIRSIDLDGIDAVIHFAGRSRVDESMASPRLYFQGNLGATLTMLDAVIDAKVPIIFSSTAAVYGVPETTPIDEEHPKRPVNPYGETKLAVERALEAYGAAYGLKWAALRYFNAAGANVEAGLGERHVPETHLIPLLLAVAAGKRPEIRIYGTAWPTPDGTCIRDYIHVSDLCEAHLAALDYLLAGGASRAFNLGTGCGSSVREVIEAVRRVTKRTVRAVEAPVRPGDPPALVAKVDRARELLGWTASRSDLDRIVTDAWAFETR